MRFLTCLSPAVLLAGCGTGGTDAASDELTSATGREHTIQWDSYVYASPTADTATIQRAIQRQVKSALGALRQPEVGLLDRDALHNVDPSTWKTETLTVVDTANPSAPPQKVVRVRYHYADTAIARAGREAMTLPVPLLFGDYVGRAPEIIPSCSDDPEVEPDSLWFHFTPGLARCGAAMTRERRAIDAAAEKLGTAAQQTSRAEVDRLYLTVRAALAPVAAPPVTYPEYDRLWGFGSDRTRLVVYAFFGVDRDERDPKDASLVEHLRFLRTLRAAFPELRVTSTRPQDMLLDYWVDGQKLSGITFEEVFDWVIDDDGYPAVAADAARKEQLRQQVIGHFAERWVTWELPVTVGLGAATRDMTVELRSYWGYEDGKPEWREAARRRYLEGMWHGDVFLYQGHSHFGHGPLEPSGYRRESFPDRYQTMLINSCLSFNYYDVDFLAMHPGGSRNLDIVVNGLPGSWSLLGQASANYVIGLVDGTNKPWRDILAGMSVTPPWAPSGDDPLRAVNGELDNAFDPKKGAITLTVK